MSLRGSSGPYYPSMDPKVPRKMLDKFQEG